MDILAHPNLVLALCATVPIILVIFAYMMGRAEGQQAIRVLDMHRMLSERSKATDKLDGRKSSGEHETSQSTHNQEQGHNHATIL